MDKSKYILVTETTFDKESGKEIAYIEATATSLKAIIMKQGKLTGVVPDIYKRIEWEALEK